MSPTAPHATTHCMVLAEATSTIACMGLQPVPWHLWPKNSILCQHNSTTWLTCVHQHQHNSQRLTCQHLEPLAVSMAVRMSMLPDCTAKCSSPMPDTAPLYFPTISMSSRGTRLNKYLTIPGAWFCAALAISARRVAMLSPPLAATVAADACGCLQDGRYTS